MQHDCLLSLTKVSPDRCHGLAFGKAVHSQTAVPVSATKQELGIMRHNKQVATEWQAWVERP